MALRLLPAAPPSDAIVEMDHARLILTGSAALAASHDLLALYGADQATCQGALEGIATDLAQVLSTTLAFMPRRDEETNQLLGALTKWLP